MRRSRVVVFRPGALGDTIVTIDALVAIRQRYASSTIELVGNAQAARLLQSSRFVDIAASFESLDVAALYEKEPRVADRWRGADLAVLWLSNPESIEAAFRSAGVGMVVAASPHPPRAVGASPASPRGRGEVQHISDYLVETLRPAGIAPISAGLALLDLPGSLQRRPPAGRRALLHPGSGSSGKNWPSDRFAELARRLIAAGWSVGLLQGPADAEPVDAVRRLTGQNDLAVQAPEVLTALASRLAAASLYIGNDSGVSHLAGRLGVPTVAIFGPTDPGVWAPRGPRVAVVGGDGSWPTVDRAWEATVDLIASADAVPPAEAPVTAPDGMASRGRTQPRIERGERGS